VTHNALGHDHPGAPRNADITGVTKLLVETLDKRTEDVVVLIEELDPDNWGQGGITASELRRRRIATTAEREGEKTS
jgi:4-oxalocrotonate tautomerase family enzyme